MQTSDRIERLLDPSAMNATGGPPVSGLDEGRRESSYFLRGTTVQTSISTSIYFQHVDLRLT